jgi:hypothetical protein
MMSIYSLIYQVLAAGYLSTATEAQIFQMLAENCTPESEKLLLLFKHAIAFGHVTRQPT